MEGTDHIRERLDGFWGCDKWIDIFPRYGVRNLDFYGSDQSGVVRGDSR